MPSEAVVDALRKVHRSLRLGGLMLDVHPQPQPLPIEVRTEAGTSDLGQLEYSPSFIDTMSNADEAPASLDRDGTFRNERKVEFLFLHHFESLAEWQDYMTKEAQYYLPPVTTMIETIGRGRATAGADLVLRERTQASRFRRQAEGTSGDAAGGHHVEAERSAPCPRIVVVGTTGSG